MGVALRPLLLARDVSCPVVEVVGEALAVEQLCCRSRVHRAVAAMNVLLEQRARGVAAHADPVPAIVNCGPLTHGGDPPAPRAVPAFAAAPPPARRPVAPAATRGGSAPRDGSD